MKKIYGALVITTLILSHVYGIGELVVFAQETAPIEIQEEIQPLEPSQEQQEEISLEGDSVVVQEVVDEPVVQDTVSPQDDAVVDIVNDASGDTEIVPPENSLDDAANEDIVVPDVEEQIDEVPQDQDSDIEKETEETPTLEEVVSEQLVEEGIASIEIVKPRPVYTFAVTSRKVATQRKEIVKESHSVTGKQGKRVTVVTESEIEKNVETTIDPIIDEEKGTMTLEGACSNKYFVVLVYKNESDYVENANSYIVNKAFPCENGTFSYTITSLPKNLTDGTYYILIGEQGDTGTWAPASQLTEIVLNRN